MPWELTLSITLWIDDPPSSSLRRCLKLAMTYSSDKLVKIGEYIPKVASDRPVAVVVSLIVQTSQHMKKGGDGCDTKGLYLVRR